MMSDETREKQHHRDISYTVVKWSAMAAIVLAIGAFGGVPYSIYTQSVIASQLCNTINASRGPDAGKDPLTDPTAVNMREQVRQLWVAVGQAAKAAAVPNATPLDCTTGKPVIVAPPTKEK